ncbi:hypothetical protein YTPLAS18_00170 [Nitrospira sp.]|nr:hypothetical protein YTPLAS18_00170 [Nitrospira sp.]
MEQGNDINRSQDDATTRLVDAMIATGVAVLALVIVLVNAW